LEEVVRPLTLAEVLVYGQGIERSFLCPVHGDRRPSASVNVIKKQWVCYTCGAHGGLTGDAVSVLTLLSTSSLATTLSRMR
jgi:DNA primase